ncbi:MAG: endonuclease/exonuclease/phosphatase family protein, partial [Acidimicrobiia bacterium]
MGTWVRWPALAALMVLVVAGAALPGAPAGAAPGTTLRVLTWNIHSEGPERLAEAIEESGADVVALQEVDVYQQETGCRHQAFDIAESLGMQARFGANIRSGEECGNGRPALYGDALLSRHPIIEWGHTLLPNRGGEQRGLLEAVLDVDGSRVRVVSTHLEYA